MFGSTGPRKTLSEMDKRELIIRSVAFTIIGAAMIGVGAIQFAHSNELLFRAWCAGFILFASAAVAYANYDHLGELYRRRQ
jgi:hypothetical protein